ncbi:thioredoxin [Aphelenchoides avenae]|nr:thioredoxin [Aphelenchus avenae]
MEKWKFFPLARKDGTLVDAEKVLKGRIVGLYFSAHWCPPCRRFTPQLDDFYKKLKEAGEKFEIVFISADESEKEMMSYMKESHGDWYHVPFYAKKPLEVEKKVCGRTKPTTKWIAVRELLERDYEVEGYPTLVVLDELRRPLTLDGRDDVEQMPALDALALWRASNPFLVTGKKYKGKTDVEDNVASTEDTIDIQMLFDVNAVDTPQAATIAVDNKPPEFVTTIEIVAMEEPVAAEGKPTELPHEDAEIE